MITHADRAWSALTRAISAFVFVARADGTFARQRIEAGTQIGDRTEIRSGLEAGAQVVVEGGLFMQFAENQ